MNKIVSIIMAIILMLVPSFEVMGKENTAITISFAGDCTLGSYKGQGSGNQFGDYYEKYDADYFFQNVREIFEADDITFINLEGALTNYKQVAEKTYPIKGEPEYIDCLTGSSIEVVNLANNHIYDCGQKGFDECIQILENNNVGYCGEGYSYLTEVKGINIGFLGYRIFNITDTLKKQISDDIASLRNNGCSIVCVQFHGGIEREYNSNKNQEDISHYAVDAGADIVVGAHPHVVQGIEIYNEVPICYSLGNFCFGANKNPKDKDTFIFQQTFVVDDNGNVSLGEGKVIPCKISSSDERNDYCPTPQIGAESERILNKLKESSSKYEISWFDF